MEKTTWLERLSANLDHLVSEELRTNVMAGSESLSSGSAPGTKARWICGMLERLEAQTPPEVRQQALSACHCSFPQAKIRRLKAIYDETGRVDLVVEALREEFGADLRRRIGQEGPLWAQAIQQTFFQSPWLDGNIVNHIAPPYHPREYLEANDFPTRRAHYCHCGWINGSKVNVSQTFCNCGAGFYQSMWEQVLGLPVEVRIINTVFQGADDCRMQVVLPVSRRTDVD